MTSILELKEIEFCYDSSIKILDKVNLKVDEGEVITIFGKSGIGKSTLLKIICGLLEAKSGKVYLDGKDITNIPANKRNIVMTLQDSYLFPHMTVEDNIGFSMKMYGKNKTEIKERVNELLNMIGLSGYEKKKPKELSGGEKKRVALARAIADYPRLILLDEPFTGLDEEIKNQILEIVKLLNKKYNTSLILITHDIHEAKTLSDRIIKLEDGKFKDFIFKFS